MAGPTRRAVLGGLVATAGAVYAAPTAGWAEVCRHRGLLDVRYCDNDRDLVADTPSEPEAWLDPPALALSYVPAKGASVYEKLFAPFMAHLADKTGKAVHWYATESYVAHIDAMRAGRLHVAGMAAEATVFAVNLAGYVPFAVMGREDGAFGPRLQLIAHSDSDILTVKDLKGRKVAHVTPSSHAGNRVPQALFRGMGVVPGEDYELIYSGKPDNSIRGVIDRTYDAAAVASDALERMLAAGEVARDRIRIVWQSEPLPPTSYGYVHDLAPELQRRIKDAFFTYDWRGTGLEKEFGERADRFIPITYERHWRVIRAVQRVNGVQYTQESLAAL